MDKYLPLIIVPLICLSQGCSQSSYRSAFKTNGDENSPESAHGAYTTVRAASSDSTFIGELIFIDDSIYFLMGDNQMAIHPIDEIVTLNAQLTRFNERSYLTLMAIAIPSALGLLSKSKEVNTIGTVGLVAAGPGLFFSLVENAKHPHFISYPDEPIEAFKKYARYPEVLPEDFMVAPPAKFNGPVAIETYNRYQN